MTYFAAVVRSPYIRLAEWVIFVVVLTTACKCGIAEVRAMIMHIFTHHEIGIKHYESLDWITTCVTDSFSVCLCT